MSVAKLRTSSGWVDFPFGVADASPTSKGVIKLAGDLAGTADAPEIADYAVTFDKIESQAVQRNHLLDGAVSDSKVGDDAAIMGHKLNYYRSATPPVGPADGDIWLYPFNSSGAGTLFPSTWMFIYSSVQPTYKWIFAGGPPMYNAIWADITVAWTGSTWVQPYAAANNPSLSAPRPGMYQIFYSASLRPAAAASYWIGLQISGTNPTLDQAWCIGGYSGVAGARATLTSTLVHTGAAQGAGIAMVYYQATATQNFSRNNAIITMIPMAVN